MPDLLVNLYDDQLSKLLEKQFQIEKIQIVRALAPNKIQILEFIKKSVEKYWKEESFECWQSECEKAILNDPPSCFIAKNNKEIIGFCCYNATAKGFVGPMGVIDEYQKMGIGKALLFKALQGLKEENYGYAIVGWPAKNAIEFYKKTVNAIEIMDSRPGIYSRLI